MIRFQWKYNTREDELKWRRREIENALKASFPREVAQELSMELAKVFNENLAPGEMLPFEKIRIGADASVRPGVFVVPNLGQVVGLLMDHWEATEECVSAFG